MVSSSERPPDASSETATERAAEALSDTRRTPIAIWILYILGILAAVVVVTSLLFAIVVAAADDTGFDFEFASLPFIVWGGLAMAALVTWLWRRGGPS